MAAYHDYMGMHKQICKKVDASGPGTSACNILCDGLQKIRRDLDRDVMVPELGKNVSFGKTNKRLKTSKTKKVTSPERRKRRRR